MAFVRTPEMTRQVKNIVDALNHKRERMIAEGNYAIIPPKLKKSQVWRVILSSPDPQAAYDRMIGTKENPGTLREVLPSLQNPKGGYFPKLNAEGESYAPASQQIDEAFNQESNVMREVNLQQQIQEKKKELPQPEWMDDDEYEGLIEGLSQQGGALGKEELPEYGTYDSEEYWNFVGGINNAQNYVDNYLEAWQQYGTFSEFTRLSNIFDKLLKYPKKLVEIFQSGDEETSIDFLYEVYKKLLRAKRNKKTGAKETTSYIAGINRIMRYWERKLEEVTQDASDE